MNYCGEFKKITDTTGRNSFNRLNEQIAKVAAGTVGREEYSVNDADQIMDIAPGGPLHVAGSLDEQGKILDGLPPPDLTAPDGSFSTWIDTEFTTGAYVTATDFNSNTTSTWTGVTPEALPTREFSYDANGNTVRVLTTAADGVTTSETTYEWNAHDRLVAVVKGAHRSEFTYDGAGRRIRIVEFDNLSTQTERYYLWDGLTLAEERNLSGDLVWRRFLPQGVIWEGERMYYAKDHLGSVRQISHVTQGLQGTYSYDAYGNVAESGAYPAVADMLYTGHYYHRPSGLYLAPFRAYDPEIGKWLSRDPIGHRGGMNLYGYVGGNPINLLDPLGWASLQGKITGAISPGSPIRQQMPSGTGLVSSKLPVHTGVLTFIDDNGQKYQFEMRTGGVASNNEECDSSLPPGKYKVGSKETSEFKLEPLPEL